MDVDDQPVAQASPPAPQDETKGKGKAKDLEKKRFEVKKVRFHGCNSNLLSMQCSNRLDLPFFYSGMQLLYGHGVGIYTRFIHVFPQLLAIKHVI